MIAAFKHIARCGAVLLALAAPAKADDSQHHVVFTDSAPLASAQSILQRTYTPLLAAPFTGIIGLPLDLTQESFTLYVPPKKPPNGYALMVFVTPFTEGHMPLQWQAVLDDHGMIYVAANNSGNDEDVRKRRMPLALTAAQDIMKQYEIDPAHVYIAGFSGGSHVALGLALAYPDLFRGALLNSGADPIGTPQNPLPTPDLFERFQKSSRIYYVTGDYDQMRYIKVRASAHSLSDFCVANVNDLTMQHTSHDTVGGDMLSQILDGLMATTPTPSDDLSDCRAKLDRDVKAQLQQVESLIASGDKAGARQLLDTLDAKYGGLAAPKSLALNAELR